jgi:hypothetical protein
MKRKLAAMSFVCVNVSPYCGAAARIAVRQRGLHALAKPVLHPYNRNRVNRQVVRCLNRLMIEPDEVQSQGSECYTILSSSDARTVHVRNILKAEDQATVRAGIVDAGR